MEAEKDDYYSVARRKQVREESRKLRKKYLRYKEAEIVYSIQHKKLLEQFRQPPKTKGKAAPKISRWKK